MNKKKFYDLDGAPAGWERGKFPTVVTREGERTIWNLYAFFMNATPITERQFEEMRRLIEVSSK
jgi:hypothetical protein